MFDIPFNGTVLSNDKSWQGCFLSCLSTCVNTDVADLHHVTKPAAFRRWAERGGTGQMGVTTTPKVKEDAYWTHKEREEFEGSDQKCFITTPFTLAMLWPMPFIVL